MPLPAAPEERRAVARLAPLFVRILLVEALTIAALYWFGRHFGG